MQFLSTIPYAGAVTGFVIIILGIASGVYMLDGYRSKKKKEEDDAGDRLVNILQKTVTELEERIDQYDLNFTELNQKVNKLVTENKTLRDIIQGKDEETQRFYKQAFEGMKLSQETNALVKEIAVAMKFQNDNVSKLIDLFGKQIEASKDAGHNIVEAAKIPTN